MTKDAPSRTLFSPDSHYNVYGKRKFATQKNYYILNCAVCASFSLELNYSYKNFVYVYVKANFITALLCNFMLKMLISYSENLLESTNP